jgi:hypothetical protein
MIYNDTTDNFGVVLRREIIDLDAQTVTVEEPAGTVTEPPRPMTADELAAYTPAIEPDLAAQVAELTAALNALLGA